MSRPPPGLRGAHLVSTGFWTAADKVLRQSGFSTSIEPSRPRAKRDKHEDPAE